MKAQGGCEKMTYTVYMLQCADGSFYVGMTEKLEIRLAEHQSGFDPSAYTYRRRPVTLVWSQTFDTEHQAFLRERQIKGWSRAKKTALIRGDWDLIHEIVEKERASREKKRWSRCRVFLGQSLIYETVRLNARVRGLGLILRLRFAEFIPPAQAALA